MYLCTMCISILIGITIAITIINITNLTVTIAASTITIARINFLFIKTNPWLKFIKQPKVRHGMKGALDANYLTPGHQEQWRHREL